MRFFSTLLLCAPRSAWCCRKLLHGIALGGCAMFLAVFSAAAAAAADIEVKTTRHGDLIEVRARATIHAPLSVVWGTLTDYEHLSDFIPGLKTSRVVSRVGATTTVEQSGEARFLFLSVPIEITLESTERPPNIEVRRIAGSVRYLQGRYETRVSADQAQVQLRWVGAITPETDLPPMIGEALMRLSIEQQFAGMVREIERREAIRRQNISAPGPRQAAQAVPGSAAPAPAARPQNRPESRR